MRYLSGSIPLLLFALSTPAESQIPEQSYTLYMTFGGDTVAIEQVVRNADRFDVDMLNVEQGARHQFTVDLDADAGVRRLTDRFYRIANAEQPDQVLVFAFGGDSVELTVQANTIRTTAVPTTSGALPLIQPSSALIEQALLRSRALGAAGTRIPVFDVVTGRTADAVIEWSDPNTATIRYSGTVMTADVGNDGRLRGIVFLGGARRVVRTPTS
jgi:hypothetical protein